MKTDTSNSRRLAGFIRRAGFRLRRTLPAGAACGGLLTAALLLVPATSRAVPSFARQMDMQCTACHTEFPVLNQFGRQFKLSGYTASADPSRTELPPLAVMLQPSYTHTEKGQAGGAAPGFNDNNNWALSQLSFFYSGRALGPYADKLFSKELADVMNKFGIFNQTTYDGVAKKWSWDNTELRFADTGTVASRDLIYGLYANNNPTLQDPWNSTPAWGYPFSSSKLAPTPAAAPLISGGLAQQVAGLGAYTFVADTLYVDLAGYRTLGFHAQKSLGVDPSGETQIAGVAPYWRVALEKMIGDAHWEIGTLGLAADTYPGRDSSAGKDRILDLGLDSQYQISSGVNDLTTMLSWIYERESWDASSELGNTANLRDNLWNLKATVNYVFDKTFGGTVQYFVTDGTQDTTLYSSSPTGSPLSDGLILQASYLPLNKNGGPKLWPRSNVKLSLQYVVYNRFNGARTNYDGNGANARDNNTLYFEAWIAF